MNVGFNSQVGVSYNYATYRGQSKNNSSSDTNVGTLNSNVTSSITLHYFSGDKEKNNALTCVGTPDGATASVYKSDAYSVENPEYKVKYWNKEGEEKEYIINPKEVDPENASYIEMLAYSTYADVNGYTKDGFNNFLDSARGVNQDINYDDKNIDLKVDFKSLVKEMMQLQYDTNNIEGYLSVKNLFDYMDETK